VITVDLYNSTQDVLDVRLFDNETHVSEYLNMQAQHVIKTPPLNGE